MCARDSPIVRKGTGTLPPVIAIIGERHTPGRAEAMKKSDVFPAWGRILRGHRPLLSIEITKECPLRCPGCYAYAPEHLGGGVELRQLSDYRGDELVSRVLALVRRCRPIHVSIVGANRWCATANWTSCCRSWRA